MVFVNRLTQNRVNYQRLSMYRLSINQVQKLTTYLLTYLLKLITNLELTKIIKNIHSPI